MENQEKNKSFIRTAKAVAFDQGLSRNAVMVYQALLNFADWTTYIAQVHKVTIASLIGRTRSTVQRGLRELEEKGIVITQYRYSKTTHAQLASGYLILDGQKQTPPCAKVNPPLCKNEQVSILENKNQMTLKGEAKKLPTDEEENWKKKIPDILIPTVRYLFARTNRKKDLSSHEIESLLKLFDKHNPTRIQKEIDTAVERFQRKGKELTMITFNYIWASLKKQQSFEGYSDEQIKQIRKESRQQKKEAELEKLQLEFAAVDFMKTLGEKSEVDDIDRLKKYSDGLSTPLPVKDYLQIKCTPDQNCEETSLTLEEAEKIIDEGSSDNKQDEQMEFLENLRAIDHPTIEDYMRLRFPDKSEEVLHTTEDCIVKESYDEFSLHARDTIQKTFELDMACAHCTGDENCIHKQKTTRDNVWVREHPIYHKEFLQTGCTNFKCPKTTTLVVDPKSGITQTNQTFKTYKPTTPETTIAKAHAILAAKEERSLILAGKPGTGKTHLAVAIALDAMSKGRKVIFKTVPEMLDELRKAARERTDFYGAIQRLKDVSCLVLDDLGKEKTTEAGLDYLYQIVDYRYRNKLQTIVTTNALDWTELKNPWNEGAIEPILSRILEMGEWIKIEHAENYRLRRRN